MLQRRLGAQFEMEKDTLHDLLAPNLFTKSLPQDDLKNNLRVRFASIELTSSASVLVTGQIRDAPGRRERRSAASFGNTSKVDQVIYSTTQITGNSNSVCLRSCRTLPIDGQSILEQIIERHTGILHRSALFDGLFSSESIPLVFSCLGSSQYEVSISVDNRSDPRTQKDSFVREIVFNLA